jgi:hypothetical protein
MPLCMNLETDARAGKKPAWTLIDRRRPVRTILTFAALAVALVVVGALVVVSVQPRLWPVVLAAQGQAGFHPQSSD